jgi:hypothetical protein
MSAGLDSALLRISIQPYVRIAGSGNHRLALMGSPEDSVSRHHGHDALDARCGPRPHQQLVSPAGVYIRRVMQHRWPVREAIAVRRCAGRMGVPPPCEMS